jgi:hypothetical protein
MPAAGRREGKPALVKLHARVKAELEELKELFGLGSLNELVEDMLNQYKAPLEEAMRVTGASTPAEAIMKLIDEYKRIEGLSLDGAGAALRQGRAQPRLEPMPRRRSGARLR